MRGDPRNCPALYHAVVLPDTLKMEEYLYIRTTLVEAAENGSVGFIVMIATTA